MIAVRFFLNFACLCINLIIKDSVYWYYLTLTHLSLASLLWDIRKQNNPRCDAAECGVPSGAILFAKSNFVEN